MTKLTKDNSMTEIVEAYNSLTDMKVKKFSTKTIGINRLNALLEQVSETETSVQAQVLLPLEKAGALFPTEFETLTTQSGKEVTDRRAVVDSDTKEYVSTVGTTYNLINNREAFTNFANTLASSDIDTTGMVVRPVITKSKCYVNFTFPAHRVEIRKDDFTELMITCRNSYDGTSKFIVEIGGFRLLCSNGQGIGQYTNVYSNRHSSGYSEKNMSKYIETALEVFAKAGEEWQKMTEIKVSDDEALEVLKVLVEDKKDLSYKEVFEGKQTKLKKAVDEWERYKDRMGANKFSLYNTVTHLTTHVSTETGNIVGLKVYKEKLRDKALNCSFFKVLGIAV